MAWRNERDDPYSGFSNPRLVAGMAEDLRNLDKNPDNRQRRPRADDDDSFDTTRNERSARRDVARERNSDGERSRPNTNPNPTERERAIREILSRSVMNGNGTAEAATVQRYSSRDMNDRAHVSSHRDGYGDAKTHSRLLWASGKDDTGDVGVHRVLASSKRSPYGDEYITSREQPSSRRDNGRDVDLDAHKGSRLRENEVDSTEYRRPRVVEPDSGRANVIYREPSKTSRDRRDPPNPRRERRDDDSGYGTGRSSPTSRTVSTYGIRDERAVLLDRVGGGRSPAPRGNTGDGKARVVVYKRR